MNQVTNRKLSPSAQPDLALRPSTKDRNAIPVEYKWDPFHIYPDWEAWEQDLTRVPEFEGKILAMKGHLRESALMLADMYETMDELGKLFTKLGCFAHLISDSDQRDNSVQAQMQKVGIAGARLNSTLSWITPELLSIKQEQAEQWLNETPRLEPYKFKVRELYRLQKHVLDEASEKLLSYASRIKHAAPHAYEMLTTADAIWPEIELSTGLTKITEPTYSEIVHTNRNQADRRAAFHALMGVYKASLNTYAALYDGVCQRDWCDTQSRKYESCLHEALEGDNIPTELYSNLIEVTRSGSAAIQRYYRLRKKALKLDTYDFYDNAIPLVEHKQRYPFAAVPQMVLEAVAPLGEVYATKLKQAFGNGWMDVYENDGKRTGAYSMGVYGVHPFILLNYADTINDVFTVAHELGHSLHTLFSHETQPFATCHYTIFVAEVASTMNEALLLEYMINHTNDPDEQIMLLERSIDQVLGTYFAQVRFAEYEWTVHKLVEEGKPITAEVLDEITYNQLKETFGDTAEKDPMYAHAWSRIPHFFRTPFYVYQYATSFAASAKLALDVIPKPNETAAESTARKAAVERYLTLLRSGGNDHPIEQLKKAGVDLTSPETIQSVLTLFEKRVGQLEEVLKASGRI